MAVTDIESPGGEDTELALALHKLANKPRGCMVTRTADLTAQNYTTYGTMITWNSEAYDTDGCHDNVTNNTRLTVPSGWSFVRIAAMVDIANQGSGSWALILPRKNGSDTTFIGNVWTMSTRATSTSPRMCFRSGLLSVVGGTDYFELGLLINTDTSIDVKAHSWFELELVA